MYHDNYIITDEREERLWNESIIVFDSSALLDFYFLPKKTRQKIFNELFNNKLKDRLWSPSHVKFEYLKNRESVIKKPISENYKPLKEEIIKKIKDSIALVDKNVTDLKNRTKNDDKHPHLDQKEIDYFYEKLKTFKNDTEKFEEEIKAKIGEVEESISKLPDNDDVKKAFETYFEFGREYTFEEIIEITKEGKHRFEFKIPPGYGDFYNKEKKGTQIFGDLIIWKQILEFTKNEKKPILFITNDISKDEDWCYIDKKSSEIRVYAPREELIKEINDHSGVELWIYNLPQFLYLSNKYLKSTIQDDIIQNISYFLTNTTRLERGFLKFKCNKCSRIHIYGKSEIELDFDCIDSIERSMGTENHYLARVNFECECGNLIEADFEVWEYPVGAHNYDSIELEGGELLQRFSFTVDFHESERIYQCEKCGDAYSEDLGSGLCQKCEDEYNQK